MLSQKVSRKKHLTTEYSARLRYWRRWWLIGFCLICLVVYLSLANIKLPSVPSTIGDKINHLIAYGVLMGWFGQLLLVWRHRVLFALALILLGITMEYLQGLSGYRFFDWQDAVANSLGVVLGLTAIRMGADKILFWFESLR